MSTTAETTGVLSERKQARREKWRLVFRRPSFIVGVVIVLAWGCVRTVP